MILQSVYYETLGVSLLQNRFLLEIQRTAGYLILLKHTDCTDYTNTLNFLDKEKCWFSLLCLLHIYLCTFAHLKKYLRTVNKQFLVFIVSLEIAENLVF